MFCVCVCGTMRDQQIYQCKLNPPYFANSVILKKPHIKVCLNPKSPQGQRLQLN